MKKFGVIGFPIKHSFSPGYFAQKFADLELDDCEYQAYEIEDLKKLKALVKKEKLSGFNVTIPHKQSIIPMLKSLSNAAKAIGAVNTVSVTAEGWFGDNTDFMGFRKSLSKLIGNKRHTALIFGTGGSCKAVKYALEQLGIQYSTVSRGPMAEYSYTDLTEKEIAEHSILINTTPLGSPAMEDECVSIPYNAINAKHLCYDLIYKPEESLFLKKAKEKGATIKNGLEMLQIQADESWKIWDI